MSDAEHKRPRRRPRPQAQKSRAPEEPQEPRKPREPYETPETHDLRAMRAGEDPNADAAVPRYDLDDAAADTGASEEEIARAWEGARQDAEEAGLVPVDPAQAAGEAIVDAEHREPPDTLPFDDLEPVDSDDALAIGNDEDISGGEDLEEIDLDTNVDTDEDVSTKDLGTH